MSTKEAIKAFAGLRAALEGTDWLRARQALVKAGIVGGIQQDRPIASAFSAFQALFKSIDRYEARHPSD